MILLPGSRLVVSEKYQQEMSMSLASVLSKIKSPQMVLLVFTGDIMDITGSGSISKILQ